MSLTADKAQIGALSSDTKSQLTPPMEAHSLSAQLNGTNHDSNLATTEPSLKINGDHKPDDDDTKPALPLDASAIPPPSSDVTPLSTAPKPTTDDLTWPPKPSEPSKPAPFTEPTNNVDPADTKPTSEPPAITQPTSDLRDDSSAVPPMEQQLSHSEPLADQEMTDVPVDAVQPSTTIVDDAEVGQDQSKDAPAMSATEAVAEPVDVDMGIAATDSASDARPAIEETATTGQVRQREEDDTGEPAAKRARVDEGMAESIEAAPQTNLAPPQPTVDTSAASNGVSPTTVPDASATTAVPVAAAAPVMPAPAVVAKPPAHYDDQPITPLQYRHILDLIRRAKKTKSAKNFLDPVDYVALNIPTYPTIITSPMDLGTMETKLKAGQYASANAVAADMNLIASNTNTFNGSNHPVSVEGANMKAYFDRVMQNLPRGGDANTDKKKAPSMPKPPPVKREQRQVPQPPAISPPPKPAEVKHEPYVDPNGMPIIRRDSSAANNDRPKREIHPPKNRDLPYSVRPKKKKTQVEMRFCDYALKELLKPRNSQLNYVFLYPVDPVALNIPTYFKIVKKPTDLSTIRTKLDNGDFANAKEFYSEVKLMFNNCFKFNPPEDVVHQSGKQLDKVFEETWAGKDEWIANNTRSEVASEAEDEEEEEDDAEEEAVDPQVQRMLDIQRQIAALSQEALALSTAGPVAGAPRGAKPASPKSKKKKSIGGAPKPKRQGSLGGSGVGASTKPKKVKKPVFKKLTLDQKRFVSEGIGALDEAQMRKAVQIIRNGVPSLRNVTDDELELDIDEIPDEVVFDLYQFVRKISPKSALATNTDTAADADDDYDDDDGSYAGGGHKKTGSRSKKNKPMSAREQESKIAQVQAQLQRFERGSGSEEAEGAHQRDDSSDDDASESSEEE